MYCASNLLWFESNQVKDHKDTMKNQQYVTIMQSRLTSKTITCHAY